MGTDMGLVRLFTSFDFDNDEDLRTLLVGQARNPDTPFSLADHSVKEHMTGDWEEKVRRRIRAVDQVCVLCGWYTNRATGVGIELRIAREEKKPYFLLAGRKSGTNVRPTTALPSDKLYEWTWDNLKKLINGGR